MNLRSTGIRNTNHDNLSMTDTTPINGVGGLSHRSQEEPSILYRPRYQRLDGWMEIDDYAYRNTD